MSTNQKSAFHISANENSPAGRRSESEEDWLDLTLEDQADRSNCAAAVSEETRQGPDYQ